MDSNDPEIRALFDHRTGAMHAKDIDRLIVLYSPDIVYFDLVPPLRYVGLAALRDRFLDWFEGWEGQVGIEIGELTTLRSGDVAAAHMLLRASGTRKSGQVVGYWVRTSNCCQRAAGKWLITHEHVSLPVNFENGQAVMDLVP